LPGSSGVFGGPRRYVTVRSAPSISLDLSKWLGEQLFTSRLLVECDFAGLAGSEQLQRVVSLLGCDDGVEDLGAVVDLRGLTNSGLVPVAGILDTLPNQQVGLGLANSPSG
jgi:hypothetical protein